ncbi:MAG: DUF1730 domain-containing protein [Gemmatimonadales bacterium]|nr:DUF1730 domain-containing protein [Gemmatimonadales bacterium]
MKSHPGEPIVTVAKELAGRFADLCPQHRIDLAGALNLPCALPLGGRFETWVAAGCHGGLEYMARAPEERLDPMRRNPWARSLLVFAQRYTNGWSAGDPDPTAGGLADPDISWINRVSRYARGRDYHDVLLKDIRGVMAGLEAQLPGLVSYASTDTGPFLEREYAWLAGLGFLGKNTCLIHERMGSGLFLGVALTNLEIKGLPSSGEATAEPLYATVPRRIRPSGESYLSACGSCVRCIEACPTGAILPEGGLDAGRCLSNFTIEQQGRVPEEFSSARGGIIFGCDICQAVCPWNARASGRSSDFGPPPFEYAALPEHDQVDLSYLAAITDGEFRRRFRRTPIWRCHPEGLRRNAVSAEKEK